MMRYTLPFVLLLCGFCTSPAWSQRVRLDSSAVVYDIEMTTKMTIPRNRNIQQVRVWHALPTPRPWFGPVESVSWSPLSGERQYNQQHDSHHVFFRQSDGLTSNRQIAFQTRFQVVSQDRKFDPRKSKTSWRDIPDKVESSGNPEVKAIANASRKETTPALALLAATQEINQQMQYDANVPYYSIDLDNTVANRKGHCGHYFTLLQSVCGELGIAIRRVHGLNLYCSDGVSSDLQKVRADYTNIHTWAEVHLPKDGWIEIEPTESKTPFTHKARHIQNNPWFQNYSVWIRENDTETAHRWQHVNGRYVSDYAMSHIITYTVQPVSRAKRLKRK